MTRNLLFWRRAVSPKKGHCASNRHQESIVVQEYWWILPSYLRFPKYLKWAHKKAPTSPFSLSSGKIPGVDLMLSLSLWCLVFSNAFVLLFCSTSWWQMVKPGNWLCSDDAGKEKDESWHLWGGGGGIILKRWQGWGDLGSGFRKSEAVLKCPVHWVSSRFWCKDLLSG